MIEDLVMVVMILVMLIVVEKILKIVDVIMYLIANHKRRNPSRIRKSNNDTRNPIGFQTNKN